MRAGPFNEEHDELRTTLRRLLAEEVTPHVDAWERAGRVGDGVLPRLGTLGLLGLGVPVADGGQGGDLWSSVVLAEELARAGSASLARLVGAQTDLAIPLLHHLATPQQRARFLEPALLGELLTTVALPTSDDDGHTADQIPHARAETDGWVLEGTTPTMTGGALADLVLVLARSADAPDDDHAPARSLFLVGTGLPGVEVAPAPEEVGLRASGAARIHFHGVRVDHAELLGTLHGGAHPAERHQQQARLLTAAGAVATSQELFDRALAYTRDREAFGRPIGRFQVIAHRLADLATRIAEVRALTYGTCELWSRTTLGEERPAMCALAAGRLTFEVADAVLQLHGGYGYTEEFPIARAWRDSRLQRLDDGADEHDRERIATRLFAREGRDGPPDAPGAAATPAGSLFTAEHDVLRQRARDLLTERVVPYLDGWEQARDFPRELFRAVGEAGFLGLRFSPEVGGSGPDLRAQAVWVQELSRCLSAGLAADLGASTDLAATYIERAGSDEQRQRFLPGLLTGARIGALAITEPGAGSDVAGLSTRARRDGEGWILDGSKVFITNGPWADHLVVAAKVRPEDGAPSDDPHQQLTLFVVDGEATGLGRRRLEMLGWWTSHTGELTFDQVRVGDDRRLGGIGSGFGHIMAAFAWERLVLSLGAVAAAERTLELGVQHLCDREEGGRPVRDAAVWRHRFADLATRIEAGRALTEQGLRLLVARDEEGLHVDEVEVIRTVAMAKLVTQRLAFEVADEVLQVHGRAGVRLEAPIQRAWRDARLGPIGGGTDEIMRQIIARTL